MGGKSGTTTSSVKIPPEVLARYNAVNKIAEETAKQPFQQYGSTPDQFVAQLNEQQKAGQAGMDQYANAAQPVLNQVQQGYTPEGFSQGVQGYMNPYLSSAVASTRNQMQNVAGQQQAAMKGSAIGQGAFGGDRANIGMGNLINQQNLALGQTIGGMESQGFQNAAQNYMSGLNQRGQTALAAQQAGLQGAQGQIGAGTLGQQTEQAGKTALYNQFQQQQAYPFQIAQFLANIAMGTGALSGSTTTTTGPTSWFSDRRLKEDIKRIGTAENGLPIYKFKYKGDETEQTHVGYMADEVEKVHPEAVGKSNGFKTVDYDQASKPVHRANGGATNSEGGVVSPMHMREGYFDGGDVISQNDLESLLAAQMQMYAPFEAGGIYGGSQHTAPGSKGVVPSANLHVSRLATATPSRMQEGDTLMGSVEKAANIGDTIKKMNNYRKEIIGNPAKPASAAIPADPKTGTAAIAAQPAQEASGLQNPNWFTDMFKSHGGAAGYADGGGILPYSDDDEEDPMSKVVSNTEKDKDSHTLVTAQNPTGQPSSSTLGDLSKIASIGSSLAKAPAAISGLGTAASGLGSALGAGAGTVGAGLSAGTAAGGIGSSLAGMGTAAAEFLPMLLAFSDKRVKHDIRKVGMSDNGLPIYKFKYDGDDSEQTHIGYMAQDVEKVHPDAVGQDKNGIKFVDYAKATKPIRRGNFAEGGDVVEEPVDEIMGKYAPAIANIESGGNYEALGPVTNKGDRAYGKYQVMGANIPSWTKEATGAELTPDEFLANKEAQDATFKHHFGKSLNQYGTPEDAASVWFSGRPRASAGNASDVLGTTVPSYLKKFTDQINPADLPARGASPASAVSPSGGAEPKKSLGDTLMSEQFVIPLLAGLGTMAGSNSRYLGSAILQGIGGGAQAYEDVKKNILEREFTKAQTSTQNVVAAGEAQAMEQKDIYKDANGVVNVYMPNGTLKYADWVKAGRPPTRSQAQSVGVLGRIGAASGNDGTQPPAGPNQIPAIPKIGETATPAIAGPTNVGNDSLKQIATDAERLYSLPEAQRTAQYTMSQNREADLNAQAEAARTINSDNLYLAKRIMMQPDDGFNASGPNNTFRIEVATRLNDALGALGLPQWDNNKQDNSIVIEKLRTAAAAGQVSAAGQRSLESLMTMLQATPGAQMSKEAALQILGRNIVNAQLPLDQLNYLEDWKTKSEEAAGMPGMYLAHNAINKFRTDHPKGQYDKEQNAIGAFFTTKDPQTGQTHFEQYVNGEVDPKDIEAAYGSGFLRYLETQ